MRLLDARARMLSIHDARRWVVVRVWPAEGWQVCQQLNPLKGMSLSLGRSPRPSVD